jgi:hypothetical protein
VVHAHCSGIQICVHIDNTSIWASGGKTYGQMAGMPVYFVLNQKLKNFDSKKISGLFTDYKPVHGGNTRVILKTGKIL